MMHRIALILVLMGAGCASTPKAREQALYFSLEVRREGKVVAKPKFLGETGKVARVERRHPGAALPDYELVLMPKPRGDRYEIVIDLSLPELRGHSELALLHGEVRKIELGPKPGELQLELMMMKVDSPEFRTLMELAAPREADSPRSI